MTPRDTPAAPTTPDPLLRLPCRCDNDGWYVHDPDCLRGIAWEARAEALDPHRLGGLIERAIRESRRKNGLIPDGWTLVEMALAYSPETPTEPSLSSHNREADHE